jgi:hypothetical protein
MVHEVHRVFPCREPGQSGQLLAKPNANQDGDLVVSLLRRQGIATVRYHQLGVQHPLLATSRPRLEPLSHLPRLLGCLLCI